MTDLSVMHYINITALNTRRILTGRLLPTEGMEVEEQLEFKRGSIGRLLFVVL
jgi:hypothetical protein